MQSVVIPACQPGEDCPGVACLDCVWAALAPRAERDELDRAAFGAVMEDSDAPAR